MQEDQYKLQYVLNLTPQTLTLHFRVIELPLQLLLSSRCLLSYLSVLSSSASQI